MRILFVLENYFPHVGGVEVLFKTLAEGLSARGHQIEVVTHRLAGSKPDEVINGVNVHRIAVPAFAIRHFFTFLSIPAILKYGKNADIIQTTMFNAAPAARLASRLLGKKCVVTVHEVWVGHYREYAGLGLFAGKLFSALERLIYSLHFSSYVCVSQSTAQELRKLGHQGKVIYNPVDYAQLDPRKYSGEAIRKKLGLEKNFVYLFHGRPGGTKGLEYLLNAVPLISKSIPNSRFMLILSRDKSYEKRYAAMMRLSEELGIRDRIVLLDPVPYKELPNYLLAADCVVVPSISEGFGYSAVEACTLGVPVVASNTTSLPEVVSGKFVLVKPRSPEAIAIGVGMVKAGKCMKTPLKRFPAGEAVKKYEALYKELLRKP